MCSLLLLLVAPPPRVPLLLYLCFPPPRAWLQPLELHGPLDVEVPPCVCFLKPRPGAGSASPKPHGCGPKPPLPQPIPLCAWGPARFLGVDVLEAEAPSGLRRGCWAPSVGLPCLAARMCRPRQNKVCVGPVARSEAALPLAAERGPGAPAWLVLTPSATP